MLCNRRSGSYELLADELARARFADERQRQCVQEPAVRRRGYSYRMKLARETILLDPIEYRILRFLADRPYRAHTRRRIAEAVSTERSPVLEQHLDRHIDSLRSKLGFFWHFIQTVPYIGYRFKA